MWLPMATDKVFFLFFFVWFFSFFMFNDSVSISFHGWHGPALVNSCVCCLYGSFLLSDDHLRLCLHLHLHISSSSSSSSSILLSFLIPSYHSSIMTSIDVSSFGVKRSSLVAGASRRERRQNRRQVPHQHDHDNNITT